MRWTWIVLCVGLGCRPTVTDAPTSEPELAQAEGTPRAIPDAAAAEPESTEPLADESEEWEEVEQLGLPPEAERFSPRTHRVPRPPAASDSDMALTRDLIRRVVREHQRALRGCYETHAPDGLEVHRLQQRWVMVEEELSRVEYSWTGEPSQEPTALIACLEGVSAKWTLPPPREL